MAGKYTNIMARLGMFLIVMGFLKEATSEPVNVAVGKPITALFTCGTFGLENYYDHVDAFKPNSLRTLKTCLDNTTHAPAFMVDEDNSTKWQSTSPVFIYSNGNFSDPAYPQTPSGLEAVIYLDLRQSFIVERIRIKLADALRPRYMAILRSNVLGGEYTSWAYRVSSPGECVSVFSVQNQNVPAAPGEAICSDYVRDTPVRFETIEFNFTSVPSNLREWKRAHYIMIQLFQLDRTVSFELSELHHFAISELEVWAECLCNGHQTGCTRSVETGIYECICGGNTMGQRCERCQPLYNQKLWEYGMPCEACNCFNHATECTYSEEVAQGELSLNSSGVKSGGGMCLNCQHNTEGVNCEKCKATFYRPDGVLQSAVNACVPCSCSSVGSGVDPTSGINGDCVKDNTDPDGRAPGDCFCKPNVMGAKCDTCKEEFYNLNANNPDGCQPCECDVSGTVDGNPKCVANETGQCTCKPNVEGRGCNVCKDGFYGLTAEDPDGCKPCGCDAGGASSPTCDKLDGQCNCRPNIVGRTCNEPAEGYYHPGAHAIHVEFEYEDGATPEVDIAGFIGRGYVKLDFADSIMANLILPGGTDLSGECAMSFRYSAPSETMATIQFLSSSQSRPMTIAFPACPDKWCYVDTSSFAFVRVVGSTTHACRVLSMSTLYLDQLLCIPRELVEPDASLVPETFSDNCEALQNDMKIGTGSEDTCKAGMFSLTSFYNYGPWRCDCSSLGGSSTTCNAAFGNCTCKPGVMGRRCDSCQVGFYQLSNEGCTECNCAVSNKICNPLTGQCDCPPRTVGLSCSSCVTNSWGWNETTGCRECNCNDTGSSHTWCNQTTGMCNCKYGVEGDKCTICSDTFKGFGSLGCTSCDCHMVGSTSSVCNKDSGQCTCKDNVEGILCDRCKPTSFYLHPDNVKGCLDCVCMGITTQCSSSTKRQEKKNAALSKSVNDAVMPNILIDNVTEVKVINDPQTSMVSLQATILGNEEKHWKVPDLEGNLLALYGSNIIAEVSFAKVLTNATEPSLASVAILIGYNDQQLKHYFPALFENNRTRLMLSLKESDWKMASDSANVTRAQFLLALSNVQKVLIPASFTDAAHGANLFHLEYSIESAVGNTANLVEQCQCPAGYSGLSCETCAAGYKRSGATSPDFLGECVPCECNGHSSMCDAVTGDCIDCLHDTTGMNCEQCKVGFYGNATIGTAADCFACPCNEHGVNTMACTNNPMIKCTDCKTGYVGDRCNSCDEFYFGDASQGTCTECNCNNKSMTCNRVTGECEDCTGNTGGPNCERCLDNFYLSVDVCTDCACNADGSSSTICDAVTGNCTCRDGIGGRTCDACLPNYFGFGATGCTPCNCNAQGSKTLQCGNTNGICTCKANTKQDTGKCDTCDTGYFGLPNQPCQACDCNSTGTVPETVCDPVNGQCSCRNNIEGRQCDRCKTLYMGFSENGCTACSDCQMSLGNDTTRFQTKWMEAYNNSQLVSGLEALDKDLQQLQEELDKVRENLGMTNNDITSLKDLVENITLLDTNTEQMVQQLEAKVLSLKTSSASQTVTATELRTKVRVLLDESNTILDKLHMERQKALGYESTLKQYNKTAFTYKSQGEVSGIGDGLNFDAELTKAQTDLQTIINDTTVEDAQAKTTEQTTAIDTLLTREANVRNNYNIQGARLISMDENFSDLLELANSISQQHNEAKAAKVLVEENDAAITTILANISTQYEALDADFLDAAVIEQVTLVNDLNTYTMRYNQLQTLQENVMQSLSVKGNSVTDTERHAQTLDVDANKLIELFDSVKGNGEAAVAAIRLIEDVILTFETSGSAITDAETSVASTQSLIDQITIPVLDANTQQSLDESNQMLQDINAVNYQTAVLSSDLTAAAVNLQQAKDKWPPVNNKLDDLRTRNTELLALSGDATVNSTLSEATSATNQANSINAAVLSDIASMTSTLSTHTVLVNALKSQAEQTVNLITRVEDEVTALTSRINSHANAIASINQLTPMLETHRGSVDGKISSIESKLTTAKSLLNQLSRPVNFNGTSGMVVANHVKDLGILYTDVAFKFKKETAIEDALLFFAEDVSSSQMISVNLVNNKVQMNFDNGARVSITSRAVLCDNCWIKVQASRYLNRGHLSVVLLPTGGIASDVDTGGSATPGTMMFNSELYFGSLPPAVNTTKVIKTDGFKGCLYDASFNGVDIDLWMESVIRGQGPICCSRPPSMTPPLDDAVRFDGSGQLVLMAADLDISAVPLLVTLKFRTFNPNAHLILVSNDNMKYSVYLAGGKIVFEYGNAVTPENIIETTKVYSTGDWFQVDVQRDVTENTLDVYKVEDLLVREEVPPTAAVAVDLAELKDLDVTLGSDQIPNSVNPATEYKRFSGCMRDFTYRTGSVIQRDLGQAIAAESGVYHNACYNKVIPGVVFLASNSFVRVNIPTEITSLMKVQMDVVTTEANGILVDFMSGNNNLYITLFNGNIFLMYTLGANVFRLVTNQLYISDGLQHTVIVELINSPVITVDEERISDVNLPSVPITVPSGSSMNIGGTDFSLGSGNYPVTKSFLGGITNFRINNVFIDAFVPGIINSTRAIDMSGIPEPPTTPPPLPYITEAPPEVPTCGDPIEFTYLNNGAGWFDRDSFYKRTLSQGQSHFHQSFTFEIHFAAFGRDGILFMVADSLAAPQQYLVVYLKGGFLNLTVQGSSGNVVPSPLPIGPYDDGTFHQVTIVSYGTLLMLVDSAGPYADNAGNPGEPPIFNNFVEFIMGGLQFTNVATTLGIPTANVGFQGEISRLIVYSADLDPININNLRATGADIDSQNVNPVPENAAYGLHLDGIQGSVIRMDQTTVSSAGYSVVLSVRNIKSEAMLFYLYESATDFVAMYIMDYKYQVAVMSNGNIFKAVSLDETNICDRNNHTFHMYVSPNSVELQVDEGAREPNLFQNSIILGGINGVAFIGGVSDANQFAADNGLSTGSIQGCVLSVSINGTDFDLTKLITSSTGVMLACPVA